MAKLLTTGNQLKAARALVGVSQRELAARAKVNPNTISTMEKRGAATLTSGFDVVTRVARALETLGIEFINHGEPGVKLRKSATSRDRAPAPPAAARGASKPAAGTGGTAWRGKPRQRRS